VAEGVLLVTLFLSLVLSGLAGLKDSSPTCGCNIDRFGGVLPFLGLLFYSVAICLSSLSHKTALCLMLAVGSGIHLGLAAVLFVSGAICPLCLSVSISCLIAFSLAQRVSQVSLPKALLAMLIASTMVVGFTNAFN
jgi:hypothetical protein